MTQITRTFYDEADAQTPSQITPKNLRGRIAAVKVFEDGQTTGAHNYTYDQIGNLSSDKEIETIKWTVYGKIAFVKKRDLTEIEYKYDGTGQRIYKKVATTTVTKETHYVRDGSGNVLAIYENKVLDELVIYGSSRLGSYNGKTTQGKRTLGNKKYELSNHLGNVLSVISDNKLGIDNVGSDFIADYYEPLVISESDYYPFGMAMKERSFSNEEYRFGFGGHENSSISSSNYDTEYRVLNTEICRWSSVDPKMGKFPGISSYTSMGNNPMIIVDEKGDVIKIFNAEGKSIVYVPGQKAVGDAVQKNFIENLNKIYSTKEGEEILSTLIKSNNTFDLKLNTEIVEKSTFEKNTDPIKKAQLEKKYGKNREKGTPTKEESIDALRPGGTIKSSQNIDVGFFSGSSSDGLRNDVTVLAHEIFHAYQYEKYGIEASVGMIYIMSENGKTNMSELQAVGFENYIRANLFTKEYFWSDDYGQPRKKYTKTPLKEYADFSKKDFKTDSSIWKKYAPKKK